MGGALTVGGGITAATLNCSGQVKSGSISTGTFSATTLSATATTVSTGAGSGALVVAGGAGIAGALNVLGGITGSRLDLGSGAIKTTGTINSGNIVSTGTFQANSLNASANTTSTSTGSGSLVVAGGAGIAGALNVGGGITAARLDVGSGGMKLIGGGFNTSTFVNITDTSTSTSTGSGALRVAGGAGIGGALNVGATASFVANVGIGTSSPTNKLHIQSTTANTITGIAVDGTVQQIFAYPVQGGNVAYSGTVSNHAHALITNNLQRLWITNAGNVGIGTAAPNGKLEIVGATAAAAEAFRVVAGTSSQVGVRLYEDSDGANFLRFRPLASPQTGFVFSDDGDTPILTIQTVTDRVGIGTFTPTQALDVVGSIVASGAINASTLNVSGLSKLTRLSVYDGTTDLNSGHRISAQANPGAAGAVLGYSNNQSVYGILGWNNTNSFLGIGTITNTGALNNIGTVNVTGNIISTGSISTAGGITLGSASFAVPTGTAPIFGARAYGGAVFSSGTALTTLPGSKNITATRVSNFQVRFTFDAPMPNATYVVMALPGNGGNALCTRVLSKTAASFDIDCVQRSDGSSVFTAGFTVDVVVFA
jgi:hypothetical protein